MSDYITELTARIEADPAAIVRAADLLQALRPVAQALEAIGRHRETLRETVQFVNELQSRLMIVDARPENAPLGALIRVRGDLTGTLYLGNGVARPLSKLLPVAV